MGSRICVACGETKPATKAFFYGNSSVIGLDRTCKDCRNKINTQRHREKKAGTWQRTRKAGSAERLLNGFAMHRPRHQVEPKGDALNQAMIHWGYVPPEGRMRPLRWAA